MGILKHAVAALVLSASSVLAADPALLNLIMPDSRAAGGVYVDRTLNSPLGQFLLSQMQREDEDFRKFVAATGFDPRRDLREILVASTGAPKKGNGLIVARGVFNGPQIAAFAKSEGASVTNHMGVDILTGGRGKHESGGVAFLDGSIAIAGDIDLVKAAIERRNNPAPLNSKMAAKVSEVSGMYDAWFVSQVPVSEVAPEGTSNRQVDDAMKSGALRSIEETSGGLRFGTTIEIAGEAVTTTEKDATALADVIRFLAGMVQLNRQNPEMGKLAGLLESLELSTEANRMKVSLSVPQADLEEILRSHKARAQMRKADYRQR
ncbi:MAG: hypothetical protein ACRD7E_29240 [Bryobacteraceae bacterium]